jgi:hypothetical protein
VVVSGGGSLLGPLAERLQAATAVPTERGRTLAGLRVRRLGLEAEAMLALGHSFIVQNYDEGDQLGTITVNGVIAQKWRGPVGTSGGTGYLKNYGYDSRLQYASPPYVQDSTETPYRVSQWAEIQNPSGLPA